MATATIYAYSASEITRTVGGSGSTFSSIRSGVGNGVDTAYYAGTLGDFYGIDLIASTSNNKYSELGRHILVFDTSSVPASATINSVSLSIHGNGGQAEGLGPTALYVGGASPADPLAITATDYSNVATTAFGNVTYGTFDTGGYNTISLNSSGIAALVGGGTTCLSLQLNWDINNTTGGLSWASEVVTVYGIDYSDQATFPYLTVDYTYGAPTVTTSAVTSNTSLTTATGNGNVTSDNGSSITERGVVIATHAGATTADTKFSTSGTTGSYSVSMTGLVPGTTYYYNAYAINAVGTSYGTETTFTACNFLNPTNAYADDGTYCTAGADSGVINVTLSGDGGTTWTPVLSNTYSGTETEQSFGGGATELWGQNWTGTTVGNTDFRLRISCGSRTSYTHIWDNFGFSPGSVTLTGINVKVKGKYSSSTASIGHITVEIYYGTSITPVQTGSVAFATDSSANGDLAVYGAVGWETAGSPVGAITAFGGSSAPTGWHLCDGSSVLRAGTYAALYAVIGTTYGSADGSHFTLPDLRANVPAGYKASDANFGTLGGTAGAATQASNVAVATQPTFTVNSHTHPLSSAGGAHIDGATTNLYYDRAGPGTSWSAGEVSTVSGLAGSTSSRSNSTALVGTTDATSGTATTRSTDVALTNNAVSNIQPSLTVNYIIKV